MITITRDATQRCPECGYFVLIKPDGIYCMKCDWCENRWEAIGDMTEIRKPGEK